MSYQSQHLIREAQSHRASSGMSQRALAARSGLTQAHISQIETGRLEPGLSSFIEMARALDLEVVLVPKKLIPAVEGVIRQSPVEQPLLQASQSALLARGERLVKKQKKLYGSSIDLDRIAESLRSLKPVRLAKADRATITNAIETLQKHQASPQSQQIVSAIAAMLQAMRNRIARRSEIPRPAYAIDDEDDDA